jgi:hypothetical protein
MKYLITANDVTFSITTTDKMGIMNLITSMHNLGIDAEYEEVNTARNETLLYPVTVIKDRYNGVYSKGKWTAFNCHADDIPLGIDGDH